MFEAAGAVDWPFADLVWDNRIGVSVFLRRSAKGDMPAFERETSRNLKLLRMIVPWAGSH